MTSAKKHHFVPLSILKRFSVNGKGKLVQVFDKKKGSSYPASVKDAGAENYFNTIRIDGKRVSFETMFDDCDTHLARITRSIVERRDIAHLSEQDRDILSYLAIIQLLRTSIHRTSMPEVARQLREELATRLGSNLDLDLSIDENAATMWQIEMMLKSARQMASLIRDKDWVLYTTSRAAPFWTSDNPVVKSNVFSYGDLGLGSNGVEICWPISCTHLISFRCPTIANKVEIRSRVLAEHMRSEPVEACSEENVTYYNSLQVLRSSRFVYGPTKSFGLAKEIIQDHPETRDQTTFVVMGRMGECSWLERMPEGDWLVIHGAKTHYMFDVEDYEPLEGGWRVTLSGWPHEVDVMLDDAPYTLAELKTSKGGGGMRSVSVRRGVSARSLPILHSDPAMGDIAKLTGNRTSDSESEDCFGGEDRCVPYRASGRPTSIRLPEPEIPDAE